MSGAGSAPSDAARGIIEALVGFPTVSRGSNLDLIDYAEAWLARNGAACWRTHSVDGTRANLFATLGPADKRGGIVLSGHADVVPAAESDWISAPFTATEREGCLFGRGTADMKGFVGLCLSLAPDLARLDRPTHIAISYDEEVGCKGAPEMIAEMIARGIRPDGCLVGEPTMLKVVTGHKGSKAYRCTVTGRSVHSALAPQGVNAVEYAAELVVKIRAIARRLALEETRDESYEVPHSTMQSAVIEGGRASNIVPETCAFRFDIRHLAGTDPDALTAELQAHADVLLSEMRKVHPGAAIVFEQMGEVPALDEPDGSDWCRKVLAAAGETATGRVSFGTEAGLFQRAGVPCVVCGPGDIAVAHRANEHVSLDQLARAEAMLRRLTGLDPLQ